MNLLWQIIPWEMLSGLMVTTFLILLAASIVVVASMVMFPLIDLAFKKKAKPAPAQVEPWHHDGLAAHHAQLSGPPWLTTKAFAAIWNVLRADHRFRDDSELRIAIGQKLLIFVADGVTDSVRLRNLTVDSLLFSNH
jgi:hypothetical protein